MLLKNTTLLTDPYSILKEAGVDVGYYDEVSFTGFADYTTYITVERSHEVSLNVDGKPIIIIQQALPLARFWKSLILF